MNNASLFHGLSFADRIYPVINYLPSGQLFPLPSSVTGNRLWRIPLQIRTGDKIVEFQKYVLSYGDVLQIVDAREFSERG